MLPLVLIPGMMCDARLWGPQMGALGRRPVLHAPCSEAENMGELAAQVLAVAPSHFALAGLSMGGILAMEVLRQAPDRVERLALLDTNPFAEAPEVRERREPQISRVEDEGLGEVLPREVFPNYLAAGTEPGPILDLCLQMALALGPAVFARQSRALVSRSDQCAALAAFRGPALVLMGAEDRLCPLDRHRKMAELMPQARLVIVEGAGHLPTLEQPEQTTAELLRWLQT